MQVDTPPPPPTTTTTTSLHLHPYLEALPYISTIKEKREPELWLQTIRDNLISAIAQAEFAPLAVKWTKKLNTYLDMKYPLTLDERVYFIRLYYELIILPSMSPILLDVWVNILFRLIKKKELLKPVENTLVFDWQPIYNLIERTMYRKETAPEIPYSHTKSIFTLAKVLDHLTHYFPPESADAILAALQPRFSLHRLEPTLLATCMWNLLMPVHHTTRRHVDFAFDVWSQFMNNRTLDALFLDWLARVASSQPCFPWLPAELKHVYTCGMQILDLPVGSSAVTTSISSSSSSASSSSSSSSSSASSSSSSSSSASSYATAPISTASLLHMEGARMDLVSMINAFVAKKRVFDPLRAFAMMAIYTLHVPHHALQLMTITLRSIHNFFHPSNSGKWTAGLASFLSFLASYFVRLKHEVSEHHFSNLLDNSAETLLLQQIQQVQPEFIALLKPLVFLSLFSKSKYSLQSTLVTLKKLVSLDPAPIMASLLELVYPALVTDTESHRTLACISALAPLAFAFHAPEVALNPETGSPHLASLMFLVLPGLDVNDARKTQATLQFLHAVVISHPFLASPEAMDWVVQFLNQVFYFLEQFDASTDHQGADVPRDDLDPLFYTVLNNVFAQLPANAAAVYPVALAKTFDWCRTHFLPVSATPVARLVHIVVSAHPHVALPKWLAWLTTKLVDELAHGAGTVATLRATKRPATQSVAWYLRLTLALAECHADALLATQAQWEAVVALVARFTDRGAMQLGHAVVAKLVLALSGFHVEVPTDAVLVDAGAVAGVFRAPSAGAVAWAKAVVCTQVQRVHDALTALCAHALGQMAEFETQHAFLSQLSLLLYLVKATAYWRRDPLAPETVYVDRCVDGHQEYAQLAALVCTVSEALFGCPATPVDLLELVVEIIEQLVYPYGMDPEKVRHRLAGYQYMKSMLRASVFSKTLPMAVHALRIGLCHLQRFQVNALRRVVDDSAGHVPKLMALLLTACRSEYMSLRKTSQRALYLTLQAYPSQKFTLLGKLLDSLVCFTASASSSPTSVTSTSASIASPGRQENDVLLVKKTVKDEVPLVSSAVIKGILHTLLSKPFMLACARNPVFLNPFVQGLVQLTKMQTDWKAKSIQPLLQRIVMKFMMMYPFPNPPAPPTASLQSLLTVYLPKSLLQQSPEQWVSATHTLFSQNQHHVHTCITYITHLLSNPLSLHWRTTTLGLTFSHNFMRWLSAPLAKVVIPYCTDTHPTIRKIAESCTREWLSLVKVQLQPSRKVLLANESEGFMDAFRNDGVLHRTTTTTSPPPPPSQGEGYPFTVSISTRAPDFENQADSLLSPVAEFFLAPTFLERVFHYHSLETVNSQSHTEMFHGATAVLAKQLAGLLGPRLLPVMLPLLAPFLCSDEPAKVRCGVEWSMGLLRGTKHWPDPSLAAQALDPLLHHMHKAGPELLPIWESGLRFWTHRRDPRRFQPYGCLQTIWKVPPVASHVFSESRGLVYLKVLVNAFGTRLSVSFLKDLVDQLQPLLPSPLKLVRTALAQLILEIFSVLCSSTSEGQALALQYLEQWKQAPAFASGKTLGFLFYLAGRYYKKTLFQAMAPSWYAMAEQLLLDSDPDTSELGIACCLVVAKADIPFSLSLPVTESTTVKLKRLHFLQLYVFHHLFHVCQQPPLDWVTLLLQDPSLEVRNLAGITLTGLFQCFPETQASLAPLMQAWLKSRDPTTRHAGVLVLVSRIAMYPYSMPSHVPALLEQLAGYMDDPQLYIQAAVRKAFSEFKRTHMDTWHLDLLAMTGEQVALVSDVLASSSYFV